MRTFRVTFLFATIGTLLPLAILIVDRKSHQGWCPEWVAYVWPTSYMFIATSGIVDRFWYEIALLSVSLNALLYGLAGAGLAFVFRKFGGLEDSP